jgi:hypothetical protein
MKTKDDHTLEDHKLWKLTTEVWDALASRFEPAVEGFLGTRNLDRGLLSLLLSATTCEPEPIMIADLMVRSPYTASEKFQARLVDAAKKGYLIEVEQGSFRLSEAGVQETQDLIRTARAAMAVADPLPRQDSRRLAELLARLVHACLENPPPPEPWSISASYKLMPEIEPPMPFIEQAITCLSAYRGDAHLAAWEYVGLSATAFEMLSLLWRNEATSLAEVNEHLAHRGHPGEIYQLALEELKERNFVARVDEDLSLTEDGRLFRNEVEEDTERYFFIPWKRLSYKEKTILAGLLLRLKEGLLSRGTAGVTHFSPTA